MAFVEKATLLLEDKSSQDIAKVNKALAKLWATAKKMARLKIEFRGLDEGLRKIERVERALSGLSRKRININVADNELNALSRKIDRVMEKARSAKTITVRANERGLDEINRKLNSLKRDARAGINVRVNTSARGLTSAANSLERIKRVGNIPDQTIILRRRIVNEGDVKGPGNKTIKVTADSNGIGRVIGRVAGDMIRNAIMDGARQIYESTKRGFSEIDIAETRLRSQGLTDAQRTAVDNAVTQEERRPGQVFTRGQLLGLASEALPSIGGADQADVLAKVMPQLSRLGATLVRLGISSDVADDGLNKYVKSAEQSGRLIDLQTGKFDEKKFKNFVDIIQKATIQFGKEIDPDVVAQTFKSLQSSKLALSDEGIMTVLGLMEEQRSTAGVQINQLISQLTGDRIQKKQLNKLIDLGLVDTKEIVTSKTGGKKTTEVVATGAKDDALLRSNPLAWIQKNLIPAMKKEGLDPTKSEDVAKFTGSIASDRTAKAGIQALILRVADFNKQLEGMSKLDVSSEAEAALAAQSGLQGIAEAASKVVSTFGIMTSSMEQFAGPALSAFSQQIQKFNEWLSPEGKPDATRTGLAVGGGVLGVLGAAFGVKKGIDFFTGTGANTAAVWANTGALNANTAALYANAAGNSVPGVVAGAAPVATTAAMSFFQKTMKAIGIAAVVQTGLSIADYVDPGGDLWGLTSSFDKWVKDKTGIDPSKDGNKIMEGIGDMLIPARQGFNTLIDLAGKASDAVNRMETSLANDPEAKRVQASTAQLFAIEAAKQAAEARRNGSTLFGDKATTDTSPGKLADDLGIGEKIKVAADGASASITSGLDSGGQSAAGSLTQGIVSGAQTAAGIIAAAITSAAANVRIAVSTTASASTPSLPNTGNTRLGHQ